MKKHYGWCDYRKREIVISTRQNASEMLDTLIHEALHAAMPYGGEEFVHGLANELSDMLETVDID